MFSYVAIEKRERGRRANSGEKGEERKEERENGNEIKMEAKKQTLIQANTETKTEAEKQTLSQANTETIPHVGSSSPENQSHIQTSSPSSNTENSEQERTWRVLQTPIKRDQHVLVDLCSPDGVVERRIFSKRKMKDDLEKYRLIRKAEWGGELSLCNVCNKHSIRSQELVSLFLVLLLLSDAQFLLRHVDTIKELTDILIADQHAEVNLRGYPSSIWP